MLEENKKEAEAVEAPCTGPWHICHVSCLVRVTVLISLSSCHATLMTKYEYVTHFTVISSTCQPE